MPGFLGILLFLLLGCGERRHLHRRLHRGGPALTAAAERFMARKGSVRIVVRASGTQRGIEALLAGRWDIAGASCPMALEGQVHAASGDTIGSFIFGGDRGLPIVNPKNPVRGPSTPRPRRIFRGAG